MSDYKINLKKKKKASVLIDSILEIESYILVVHINFNDSNYLIMFPVFYLPRFQGSTYKSQIIDKLLALSWVSVYISVL